jgi:hypothetical protein
MEVSKFVKPLFIYGGFPNLLHGSTVHYKSQFVNSGRGFLAKPAAGAARNPETDGGVRLHSPRRRHSSAIQVVGVTLLAKHRNQQPMDDMFFSQTGTLSGIRN